MTRKEFKEIIDYELFGNEKCSFFKRFRFKHIKPNTNCMYLARKMWYLFSRGGIRRRISKWYFRRIAHRFGCCIYYNIKVGKGFHIAHPVGIVIGMCEIGEDFLVYQNTTVGVQHPGDALKQKYPHIGDRVRLCSGSSIIGDIKVADDVVIGANSLAIKDIEEPGVYVGSPCKKIK